MATTICLINQKGGCGKSSTCFHLSGCFAHCATKVLLIDADPQGSLSQGFFGSSLVENLERGRTLAALFDEDAWPASPQALVIPTAFDGIGVVPANQSLAAHNTPVPEQGGMAQFALRQFLEELSGFDVVLIDCPPNLYQCSWNAMLAADFVMIPVPPEDFGTQGLRIVHQAIEHAHRLNPRLELLGHVVSRFDKRLLVHQSYERKLRELYGETVLTTVIPEASAFKVALACRTPLPLYGPTAKAAHLTCQLGREILQRMDRLKAQPQVA